MANNHQVLLARSFAMKGLAIFFIHLTIVCLSITACQQLPSKKSTTEQDADLKALTEAGIKFDPQWIIIPGKRVGLIEASTDRQQLAVLFPPEQLTDTSLPNSAGNSQKATVYTLDNRNTLTVFWANESMQTPSEVVLKGEKSPWATPEGIGIGTPIADIQAANAKSFAIDMFVPQNNTGGNINHFNGGSLSKYKGWQLILGYDGRDELAELTLYRLPQGSTFSSDAEFVPNLNMTIKEISITIK